MRDSAFQGTRRFLAAPLAALTFWMIRKLSQLIRKLIQRVEKCLKSWDRQPVVTVRGSRMTRQNVPSTLSLFALLYCPWNVRWLRRL